jgi:hypothetical protein
MDITKQNAYFFRGPPCIFPFHLQLCIFISKYQVRGKKECEVSRLLRSHCITVQVAPDVLEGTVGQYMPCDMASHARRLISSAILVFEPQI